MKISRDEILMGTRIGFSATFVTKKKTEDIAFETASAQCGMFYGDTADACAVEKNLNGTTEITTPLFGYSAGIVNLSRVLGWIGNNAKTDGRCRLRVYIGFNDGMEQLYKLNICKFVLGFNEEKFYSAFPKMRNAVGAKSIKNVWPPSLDEGEPNIISMYNNYSNSYPFQYGVGFNGLKDGVIEIGYFGGKGYEEKQMEIVSLVSMFAVYTYTTLAEPEYTIDDLQKIRELNDKCREVVERFSSYENFKKFYKNISITVDLREMDGQEEIYWSKLRGKIYRMASEFFSFLDVRKVELNYDTDESVFQIRGAKTSGDANLDGVDVVESELGGTYGMCTFLTCEIDSSVLKYCRVMGESNVKDSVVSNSYISKDSVCENCTITDDSTICGTVVSCKIEDGVKYTEDAVFKHCKKDNLVEI